jgi:hypothetical protein
MFEMIDTLNFRVCNLTLPPELFVKETTKAIRYKFGSYTIETAKYYPISRFVGSLSTFANNGTNYPLIASNDVTGQIKAISDTLGFNLHDAMVERIDLAFDLKTRYPLDPYNFTTDKGYMWAKSEEGGNYINYEMNSFQKMVIYQNGEHNQRPTGLRLENRYITKPFARHLSDISPKLLKTISGSIIRNIETFNYKVPDFDITKAFTEKMGKKDLDNIFSSGYLYTLNEIQFSQLYKVLELQGVEKRLLNLYKKERLKAIRLQNIGSKIDPIKQFINLINKVA